jgi:hypothetical protein
MRTEILCLALLLASGVASAQKYSGPKCLGPYCIDRDTRVRQFLQQLGPPPRRGSVFLPYCYQSQNQETFLYVRATVEEHATVAGVLLADFPNCMHMSTTVTTNSLMGWKTPEGIGLGSSEEDVVRNYGKPTREEKTDSKSYKFLIPSYRQGDTSPDVGDKQLVYSAGPAIADLSLAQFGIRNGKVCFILLLYSE